MLKNRKLLVGLVFLILFYCSFPFTKTQAAVNVGFVHSIESVKPIIDGVIDPVEWQNAIPKVVTLYQYSSQSTTFDITVYSLFDNDSTLYLGAIIPREGAVVNCFYVVFRTNATESLFYYVASTLVFGSGHDGKLYETYTNTTIDMFSSQTGILNYDTNYGGTNEGTGKGTYDMTYRYVEMAIPFNSGDINGSDLAIDYGDSIDCWFLVGRGFGEYTQLRVDDEDFDFCELIIEKLPAPVLEEISPLIDNDGSITLNWTDVLEATSYNVYRDTSAVSDISGLIPIATPIDSFYYDTGLSNGLTYYYAITAENTYGVSELSNVEQVMIHITTTSETSVSIIIILINLFGVCLGVFLIKSRKTKLK